MKLLSLSELRHRLPENTFSYLLDYLDSLYQNDGIYNPDNIYRIKSLNLVMLGLGDDNEERAFLQLLKTYCEYFNLPCE